MTTYPLPPSAIIGNATQTEVLAFLKSPTLVARRFAQILGAQNFLAHYLLRMPYEIQGGVAAYFEDESISTDDGPEIVAPGAEYPLITLTEDELKLLAASKTGFGTEISDERVGRYLMGHVERVIARMKNRMIRDFDTMALATIQSAVTETVTGSAWTTGAAIVGSLALAKAKVSGQKLGYTADVLVTTEEQKATAEPLLLDVLPREGSTAITGEFPTVMGLTWVTSEFLPDNWVPSVFDAKNLGAVAHESIPSPGYVNLGNGSNVEVLTLRKEHDSTRLQLRKADVPLVMNPRAGVEIEGTGL